MDTIKVLSICGSLRQNSYNRIVLKFANKIISEYGVELKEFDLKEFPLPFFDEDLEKNSFENVVKLKTEIEEADIIMICSPEYNHSVPGVLKNAIDWASRNKNSFSGKTAIIFGASTGNYGTLRMQLNLRQILTALNVHIEPQPQVLIGNADKLLNANSNITDTKIVEQLAKLIDRTIANYRKMKAE